MTTLTIRVFSAPFSISSRYCNMSVEKHPEFREVLIDATEQEIQKPQDKQKRKDKYSGKKKRHAVKSQITATSTRLILHVTRSLPGRTATSTFLEAPACYGIYLLLLTSEWIRDMTVSTKTFLSRPFISLLKPEETNPWTLSRNASTKPKTACVFLSSTPWLT